MNIHTSTPCLPDTTLPISLPALPLDIWTVPHDGAGGGWTHYFFALTFTRHFRITTPLYYRPHTTTPVTLHTTAFPLPLHHVLHLPRAHLTSRNSNGRNFLTPPRVTWRCCQACPHTPPASVHFSHRHRTHPASTHFFFCARTSTASRVTPHTPAPYILPPRQPAAFADKPRRDITCCSLPPRWDRTFWEDSTHTTSVTGSAAPACIFLRYPAWDRLDKHTFCNCCMPLPAGR